ncbi:hypothetical protein KZZ52_56895 [Dactylosporangium sp. AC04546]|uniref:hypothetical protein n=1 Tax=Dactylosporangium sp. AC04546 TaxID=2862460 RepID=UPI001EDCF74C|nr:hypothetical protein [Dactylosporangium sp. AC04546]WVK83290.1 hypothetical protein KZZ52_56895 [Dactylosporangium sp. AC04546]
MADEAPRRIVVIAPDGYPSFNADFRTGLDEQIDVVVSWFRGPEVESAACRLSVLRPTSLHQLEDLVRSEDLAGLHKDQPTVLYITGHGVQDSSRRHFLLFPASQEGSLRNTALVTADLVESVLSSASEQILVFVDSCHAGALHAELAERLRSLPPDRRRLRTIAVITVGDFDEKPRVGEFAEILFKLFERFRSPQNGYVQQYLSFRDLAFEMANLFEEEDSLLEPLWVWPRSSPTPVATRCIPNPGYQPMSPIVEPARQQLAQAFSTEPYWRSRASGQYSDLAAGWYFSGRRRILQQLSAFLLHDAGTAIVTGEAGSGKSAILAQLAVLTDPTFRERPEFHVAVQRFGAELIPPLASVDVALYLHNLPLEQVVGQLAELLAVAPAQAPGETVNRLLAHFQSRAAVTTIAFDGLDEAVQPEAVIFDVIGRFLAVADAEGRPLVRLLVGLRSERPTDISEPNHGGLLGLLVRVAENARPDDAPLVLRTDRSADVTSDIAEYVERILTEGAGEGAFVRRDREVERAAHAIAEAVSPSFLDARFAAARLRASGDIRRATSAAFLGRLRAGTLELFKSDVQEESRRLGVAADRIVGVLRAVAFAGGAGLPWAGVWERVAAALIDDPDLRPEEVGRMIAAIQRGRLSGYLASGIEDERVVYRPAHTRIGEILRNDPELIAPRSESLTALDPDERFDIASNHRAIAEALLAQYRQGADEFGPHPYVRRHLVRHAALGGALTDGTVPVDFLPWETSGQVRKLIIQGVGDDASIVGLHAWALAEPYLGDADQPSRRSTLAFQLVASGSDDHSAVLAPVVHTRWVNWRGEFRHVSGWDSPTWAVLPLVRGDGRCVVAAASTDCSIRLVSLDSGTEVCPPLLGHTGRVRAFAHAWLDDHELLLSGADDATVRVWDLATGRASGVPLIGHHGSVTAIATVRFGDLDLLATGSVDGSVLLWDIRSRERFGDPLVVLGSAVFTLAVAKAGGYPIVVAGAVDGTIRRWGVADGIEIGTPIQAYVRSVVVARIGSRAVIVSGGEQGALVWDLITGDQIGEPFDRHRYGVWGVDVVHREGRPTVLSAGGDRDIRVWDLETRQELSAPLVGHERGIHELVTATVNGRPIAVSASLDTTVRAWDVLSLREFDGLLLGSANVVNAVDVLQRDGQAVVACGSSDTAVTLLDLETGQFLERLPVGHTRGINALVQVDDTSTVTGAEDGLVIVARLSGDMAGQRHILDAGAGPVTSVDVIAVEGRDLILAAYEDHVVRIWDIDALVEAGPEVHHHAGAVRAVRAVRLGGRPVAVSAGDDRMVYVWDVRSGELVLPPLAGHNDWILGLATLELDDRLVIVSASDDRTVRVWDVENDQVRESIIRGHTGWVNSVAIGMIGGRIVVASAADDQSVRIWDVETEAEVHRVVVGSPMLSMKFVPVVGSADVRLVMGGIAGVAQLAIGPDVFGDGAI